ncbi:MAG TPA: hypothetical protein PKC27_04100, partial [Methanomethylovorans sp.]|nr:hypothetical protein [Methanomethylovorans sp.]
MDIKNKPNNIPASSGYSRSFAFKPDPTFILTINHIPINAKTKPAILNMEGVPSFKAEYITGMITDITAARGATTLI